MTEFKPGDLVRIEIPEAHEARVVSVWEAGDPVLVRVYDPNFGTMLVHEKHVTLLESEEGIQ